MALRINNNIAAQKAVRHMSDNDRKLVASLERLSSGFRINKGADDPAGLVISEQMRAQIAGVNQAISNTEIANSMVQTTEGALGEINNLLIRLRQLALNANNEAANDIKSLEANQIEIDNAIDSIRRISVNTRFGSRQLLDGSSGVVGIGQGGGVTFVSADERVRESPVEGFAVEVDRNATRARLEGSTSLSESDVPGLTLTLMEGGKTVSVTGTQSDSPASLAGKLKEGVARADLSLDVMFTEDNTFVVESKEFGSEQTFRAISSISGVLSEQAESAQLADPGQDIAGRIGGEVAVGRGQTLSGVPGSDNTESLKIKVLGSPERVMDADGNVTIQRQQETGLVGRVHLQNNAVQFQTGPNAGQKTVFALPTLGPEGLGRQVENMSEFGSLADVNVTNPQGARDSIRIIDAAVDEMTLTRGRLGAFQRNNLDTNLATLRVTAENLIAAESSIRDSSIAEELTEFTRAKIQLEASTALLAQANQIPATVVSLIR